MYRLNLQKKTMSVKKYDVQIKHSLYVSGQLVDIKNINHFLCVLEKKSKWWKPEVIQHAYYNAFHTFLFLHPGNSVKITTTNNLYHSILSR